MPASIRTRDRVIGTGAPILPRYERITFDKALIALQGKPLAAFVCPGQPLLEATSDLILERYRDLLKRGAILVDPTDQSEDLRVLFYLEHAIQDGRMDRSGVRRVISRQMHFVELDAQGRARQAGAAPYLDYRPLADEERPLVAPALEAEWLRGDLERQALVHAVTELVPRHLAEVRARKEELVLKTLAAVQDRLTKEINYWDFRAAELKRQEEAGRPQRLNSAKARHRADDLQARLQKRQEELAQERQLAALPPVVIGGALIVPAGLLARLAGERQQEPDLFAEVSARVERLAMEAVLVAERRLGYEARDVSAEKCGYDIESRVPGTGKQRFIEVKGRVVGSDTVTLTKNEILTALNKPEEFILALVEVDGDTTRPPRYVRQPFSREPDFGVTSVNYDLSKLLARAEAPA